VLVVSYIKDGFLPAFRPAYVPWQEYVVLLDAALTETPDVAGALDLPLGEPAREVRGRRVKDADGDRQAVLLATQGGGADRYVTNRRYGVKERDANLTRLTLRLAEYSVGPGGPAALPAPLPPGAAYAYAVEVGADEAAAAREIAFTKPYPLLYVENFLRLPAGAALPLGWYDRAAAAWVRAEGRVVRVLDVADGQAVLDVDGNGQPADADALARLGVTDGERRKLAELYQAGQTLWRMPLSRVGTWAVLTPARPPEGAAAPPWDVVKTPGELPDGGPETDAAGASVAVAGTPFHLSYHSDRAPGRTVAYTLDVTLTDDKPPGALKGVELEIAVAGRRETKTFDNPSPGLRYTFTWDGKDAYGRAVPGRRPAVVRVGYVYDRADAAEAEPARRRVTLWRERRVDLGDWDARGAALGGWTLDVQHAYDPVGRVLHPGGGGRRSGKDRPPVITTAAGGGRVGVGLDEDIGDRKQATAARFTVVRGLAVDADGVLYIADAGQQRVRRVAPDGVITTAASTKMVKDRDNPQVQGDWPFAALSVAPGRDGGLFIGDAVHNRVLQLRPDNELPILAGKGGKHEYQGEGGPFDKASLSDLGGVAVGPDGAVYVAENAFYQCVVRLGADGLLTRVAGGPGRKPDLGTACGVAVGPDGALYVADGDYNRVWRVGPDGAAVVAGTGNAGKAGDGGPAALAELDGPNGLAVGPDGAVYIADANNRRVRRVGPDGVISTVAGTGKAPGSDPSARGDGGPAKDAALDLAEPRDAKGAFLTGLAVGPEGDLYIAEAHAARVRRVAPAFPGLSAKEIVIPSEDGAETYVFDGSGRHLHTLDRGGKEVYAFEYDKEGRLATVRDREGRVTKVERDPAGRPKALVAPGGERTELHVGDDGYLSGVGDEAGGVRVTYTAGGLLTTLKGPDGEKTFTYDDLGRLKK
jgi:YD repeat-containing protein